jgi:hypothetical protein
MPSRSDTPHDRPVKGPKWVSPWGFDDEWEDAQRRHAEANRTVPAREAEAQAPASDEARERPAASAVEVPRPQVKSRAAAGPAMASPPVEAAAMPEKSMPQDGPGPAAPAEVDARYRPPGDRPPEPPQAAAAAPRTEKKRPAATAPVPEMELDMPRDPPTQKRPGPVPNSVRRSRPPSIFPWSTVITAVLGMAGIFLLGSIYFIDVPPPPDDDLLAGAPADTAPKIAGPERLGTFLGAVNLLTDMQRALKPAWGWDESMLQGFIQNNGSALDALRDLLGTFDWHPHHAAWHQQDLGEHHAWPHVRILLQARVVYLAQAGQERAALDAALDLGRLSQRLQEMWSWPSYTHRAQELHMACVQSVARLLKDTRLPAAELKVCQDDFTTLMPSDGLLQGALHGLYVHEKKLLLGENSGEPLDTMPGGVLHERPGRLFFKKQETLGLLADACRLLRDEVAEPPTPAGSTARTSRRRSPASLWFQPNGAGQTYFAQKMDAAHELPARHHLGRARHSLVLSLFAVRRYLADHQKLPSGLMDLRPDYLAEVPLDPYSGELPHYDPLRGVLFSVGDNFRAEDGHITDPPMIDPAEPTVELGIAIATPVQAGK